MIGLSVMAGVGVLMLWTIDLADGEPDIAPIGAFDIIVQAMFLVIVAYLGIGGAITRDLSNVRERLGLYVPTSKQVAISVLLIIPIFLVSAVSAALTEWFQPGLVEQIEDVMGEVTRDVANVQGAVVLGLTAGIGEETLFRGAIQPRYGIFFTSVLFALIHVQYALSFILLGVFFTGIIFGVQRVYMNTTCCIITHAVYNFAIVMLSTLA
jgi:membrane protease YdiL (CAAX protease family)